MQVERIQVYAGVTPVSVGGDSIGGSIVVDSAKPVFAKAGLGTLTQGEAGAFFRSNGQARGANVALTAASEKLSLTYAGSIVQSDNYKAADYLTSCSSSTSRLAWWASMFQDILVLHKHPVLMT